MSTAISSPLYIKSTWPGPGKAVESHSVAKPDGEIMLAGPATINIPEICRLGSQGAVRWQAEFSHAGQASQELKALPDTAIKPSDFGGASGPFTSKMRIAAQAFELPWVPGDSHLTMIAKDAAGKIVGQENFNVRGVMAAAPPKA